MDRHRLSREIDKGLVAVVSVLTLLAVAVGWALGFAMVPTPRPVVITVTAPAAPVVIPTHQVQFGELFDCLLNKECANP